MGRSHWSGPLVVRSTQALTGPGAVNVTDYITEWTTSGADAGSLVDGEEGQHKLIVCDATAGNGTLTPDNQQGTPTTVVFTADSSTALLVFTNGAWSVAGSNSVTVA